MDDTLRVEALRARCTRYLNGHGHLDARTVLASLPTEIAVDRYGAGGVVAELEAEVAAILGKPAAVFMPSGTMAQQIALRIHADTRPSRTVLMHPLAHPALHEGQALQRLHGLEIRPVGDPTQLLDLTDLQAVSEPVAALLLELPQREIGGPLPSLAALRAQADWARDRGAAVHLDGARLWEAEPHYGCGYATLADPFDSVYVSLYKGVGGVAGAVLAGEDDLVAQAREWRHRHGGQLFGMWPLAAIALAGLRERLPRMGAYVAHMGAIAAELGALDGVELAPHDPPTNMVHLTLRTSVRALRANVVRMAAADRAWTWPGAQPTDRPGWVRVEMTVGDATLGWTPAEVASTVRSLLDPLPVDDGARWPVEVVDADGAVTDVVPRHRVRAEGLRHRCTYVVVITPEDEVVVHRRSDGKDVHPGRWDLAFGGLCDVGEPWVACAARELGEEAGIVGVPLELLGPVTWEGEGAALVGRVYLARADLPTQVPDGEVAEIATVRRSDLASWLERHDVCPDSRAVVPPLLRDLGGR